MVNEETIAVKEIAENVRRDVVANVIDIANFFN